VLGPRKRVLNCKLAAEVAEAEEVGVRSPLSKLYLIFNNSL
jgi:hypothetical protein